MYSKLFELLNIQKLKLKTLLKVIASQREYILLSGYEQFLDTGYKQEKTLSSISELKLLTLKELESVKHKLKRPDLKKVSELAQFIEGTDRDKLLSFTEEVRSLWSLIQKKNSENRVLITKTASLLNRSLSTIKSYSGDNNGYSKSGNHTTMNVPNRRVMDRSI